LTRVCVFNFKGVSDDADGDFANTLIMPPIIPPDFLVSDKEGDDGFNSEEENVKTYLIG